MSLLPERQQYRYKVLQIIDGFYGRPSHERRTQ